MASLPTLFKMKVKRRTVNAIIEMEMGRNRTRDIVKKTGLDIDPKYFCEKDIKYFAALFKEYGVDVTINLEENGCKFLAKLT